MAKACRLSSLIHCSAARYRGLPRILVLSGLFLVMLSPLGCKKNSAHTSNPDLQQIDEMLNAQLPPGTTSSRVIYFLSSRGYPQLPPEQPQTVVAIIRHINTDTVQPATARVTFHFDATDRLTTYDLVRVADTSSQP